MPYDQRRIVEALRAFERGEIVVVMDDDGRENEGDLIVAAVHCTPEKMAFIVRHTSGIVCTPMPREEARRLNLSPMVAENDSAHTTAFTVSIDFKHGTTTGISADDRTATVRNLANPNASAGDFSRPGHIFPLIAREGGVLMRSGHTEAAVDLCRLAGLPPIGVICELVNDDGTVMRGPQVQSFAASNGLHQVTVADLIAYRQRQETLVEQLESFTVETPHGAAIAHIYKLPWDTMHHLAIVFGDIRDGEEVPVRLHRENVVRDVFGRRDRLAGVMAVMAERKRGVIVYLREGSVGVAHRSSARPGEEHDEARRREDEWREIGLGAQILKGLGISSINLLASRERHYVGLEGFGIRIAKTEILVSGDITTIGFDADDTLWQNEQFFRLSEQRFAELLRDHAEPEHLTARLLDSEKRNLAVYGFGIKGFTLSMIETAIEVTEGRVPAATIREILETGREMLSHPVETLPHARPVLEALAGRYRFVLITKGDLFDQERKLAASGLGELFDAVEIVSDKSAATYERVFARHGDGADRAMMVGNSLKSDVVPAIGAGAWGVYVPHDLTWVLERVEPPKDAPRFREIEHLGLLPALLETI